jgi:hypothetical protein
MLSRRREALRRLGAVRFRVGDRVRWVESARGLCGTIVKAVQEDGYGEYITVDFDNGSSYAMSLHELEHL